MNVDTQWFGFRQLEELEEKQNHLLKPLGVLHFENDSKSDFFQQIYLNRNFKS